MGPKGIMETYCMRLINFLLTFFIVIATSSCSSDDTTPDQSPDNFAEDIVGTWELINVWDNGVPRQFPEFCDNPQTVQVSETAFLTRMYEGDDSCQFESTSFAYGLDSDIIELSLGSIVIRMRIVELDSEILRFHFIYHTEEGGDYDGEIWELERMG